MIAYSFFVELQVVSLSDASIDAIVHGVLNHVKGI